jgi:glycosyltransferase involved in cell wall biosynthesis
MKILFHHRIRSKDGQFVHLEEMVKAFRDEGHEVVLVGPEVLESEAFGSDAGYVDVLRRHLPLWLAEILEFCYGLAALPRLLRAIRRHAPDFVYERYNLLFPTGAWATRRLGVPFVLEVNAPLYEERCSQGGIGLRRFAAWTQRHVWLSADLVLPVTRVLGDTMVAQGVDEGRVLVLPNGVDTERFQPIDALAAKRAIGLEGRLVLGFVGFVRAWHGVDGIIRAMADGQLPAEAHLLVVGDGPARADLESLSASLGVASRVTFTGVVGRDRLPPFIAAFDIALQPAVTSYASPLKVIEYLAMGKAILAPDQPNIREILEDGVNARLAPQADPAAAARALAELARDAALRDRLARGAAQSIAGRGLTWSANARRIVERIRRRPRVSA